MFFEIREHKLTSEATIARVGILYITDDEGYQWSSYYHFWINKIMCIIAMGNNDSLERLVGRYKYINKNRNKKFFHDIEMEFEKKKINSQVMLIWIFQALFLRNLANIPRLCDS